MATKYTCVGDVRGNCGHLHRTLTGAVRCLKADHDGCNRQGGYSDRTVERTDLLPLQDWEHETVQTLLDRKD